MFDVVAESTHMKTWAQEFVLSPVYWSKASVISIPTQFAWAKVPFRRTTKPPVPQERGIYAFVLEPGGNPLPPHGYLMYIGSTDNFLRRFREYLREVKRPKRPKIHILLNRYINTSYLYFTFAPVLDKNVNVKNLERELNDCLVPPYVELDFSAAVRPAVKAFRIT
jgi:hypothetical protein